MNHTEIKEKIIKIFNASLEDFDVGAIDFEGNLLEQGINSVIFIRVVIGLENEFNIEFNDRDLDVEKFTYVSSIASYVEEKIEESLK